MSEIKPISIKEWTTGIAESPYEGLAELRGIDVTTHPGVAILSPRLSSCNSPATTGTFTANAATDVLTGPNLTLTVFGTGYFGIRACYFTTTGTLPAGLSTNTTYWLTSSGGTTTYKVSTSLANANSGTFVDITTAGSGTHTLTTVDPGTFNKIASDGAGNNVYAIDNNGRVWQLNGSFLWYLVGGNTLEGGNNVTTNAGNSGNGIEVFKNYVHAFRNNTIDVYGPLTSSPTWTNSWAGLNGGVGTHRSLVGQDDIMYWGDDDGNGNPYIGSLQQVAGKTFAPGDATTYTFAAQALKLPQYKIVSCLAELGVNLMVGTTGREIYPWDRTSASFNLPIVCPEVYVYRIRNSGNVMYIAAGNRGNIYLYNGYVAQMNKVYPKHLMTVDGNPATVGDMTIVGRKLIFTIQNIGNSGVYSLDLVTGALSMENLVSTGSTGTSNALVMPALFSRGNDYFVSYFDNDNSVRNVDVSSDGGTYRYPTSADYNAGMKPYIVTPLLDIGYYNIPRDIQFIEVYLDRPLPSGGVIYVYYRTSVADAFTALATLNGTSTTQVFQCPAGSISSTDLQLKLEMQGGAVYLQEVRIV